TCTALGSSTSSRARYARSSATALGDALGLDQAGDGFRRLRALAEPILDLLVIELDRRGLGLRIVPADDLEEPPVTGGTRVGRHHAVVRVLLGAHTCEPELDCHNDRLPTTRPLLVALPFLRRGAAREGRDSFRPAGRHP